MCTIYMFVLDKNKPQLQPNGMLIAFPLHCNTFSKVYDFLKTWFDRYVSVVLYLYIMDKRLVFSLIFSIIWIIRGLFKTLFWPQPLLSWSLLGIAPIHQISTEKISFKWFKFGPFTLAFPVWFDGKGKAEKN